MIGSRPTLSALAVLGFAVVLLGCGIEGQPFGKDREGNEEPSALVSEERIDEIDPETPAATALKWWRGIQTKNPSAVEATYTPEVRKQLPGTFDTTVIAVLAPTAKDSSITTESLKKRGEKRATLLSTIESSNPTMNGPLALPMRKVGDRWLIADSSFVTSVSGAFALEEALREAADAQSNSQKDSEAEEPSGE